MHQTILKTLQTRPNRTKDGSPRTSEDGSWVLGDRSRCFAAPTNAAITQTYRASS